MKKFVTSLATIMMIALLSFTSIVGAAGSDYGSGGALEKESFTLEEMLMYAIQDEYTARAEYVKIMEVYGVQKPFSNIKESEERHIAMLVPLFNKYGIPVPEDTSADHVVVPDSLLEAYKIGVQAEIFNIAMYDKFLEQNNLPADVESAFIKLRDASYNHLRAFENKVAQHEGSDGNSTGGSGENSGSGGHGGGHGGGGNGGNGGHGYRGGR